MKCTCCLIIDLVIYLILRVHFCRELFNYYKLDCKFLLSTNFFYYSFLSLFPPPSPLCISKLFLYTHSQSDALTYVTRLCTVTTSGINSDNNSDSSGLDYALYIHYSLWTSWLRTLVY